MDSKVFETLLRGRTKGPLEFQFPSNGKDMDSKVTWIGRVSRLTIFWESFQFPSNGKDMDSKAEKSRSIAWHHLNNGFVSIPFKRERIHRTIHQTRRHLLYAPVLCFNSLQTGKTWIPKTEKLAKTAFMPNGVKVSIPFKRESGLQSMTVFLVLLT